MQERAIKAPEYTRFYDKLGNPVIEVVAKSTGRKRNPTITDARKNGWLVSWSAIKKLLAAPFLEAYKIEAALDAALANPKEENESEVDYKKRVYRASQEWSLLTMEVGKDIHGEVEEFFMRQRPPELESAKRACGEIEQYLASRGATSWSCEESFTNVEFGSAGTADMIAKTADGSEIILDFKTTNLDRLKRPYTEWGYQLAYYKMGYRLDAPLLVSVPIDRDSGECRFWVWGEKPTGFSPEELERGVTHLFELWCIHNKYDPRSAQS